MHTEIYCSSISSLDPVKAIRAVHQALLQLKAHAAGVECLDDKPSIAALESVMTQVGHMGFVNQSGVPRCP